jgi:fatty-acyl-CoA synthase
MDLSRIIERWAAFQPHKTAVHFQGGDLSYAELWQRVEAASRGLAARLDIGRGDRVAYLGANHPNMLVLLFALARLGAMLVPLNFRLAAQEHLQVLEDAGPRAVLVEAVFTGHCEPLRAALPGALWLAMHQAPPGWRDWAEVAAGGPTVRPEGDDALPVLVVYTSGTTGRPKGAVHTQASIIWNAVNATHLHDMIRSDHVLSSLPLFHVGGLNIQTLPALHAGAAVTLHPRFDPGAWLQDVGRRRPTLSVLVPATMRAVVDHPEWPRTDLSSLRLLITGSSPVPEMLITAFHERGVPVGQVYGSTETGPISIYLRREDAFRRIGYAGKAAVHCEVRLVGGDGHDVPRGAVGEIWVKGLNVMQGYWNDPDNSAFQGGWFKTGDLGYQDAEGFYRVVGRSKDVIISGGENIYPAELENLLAECPEIAEAAVVGADDPKWGEVAVAVIVRRPGSTLDEAGVRKLFEGRVARFKHPRRIVFAEALPRNVMGKVQKSELKKAVSAADT